MGLSRRFLNLIVASQPGVKSLRRIDMARQLFYPDTAPSRGAQEVISRPSAVKMERIRLPKPTFSFRASDSDQSDERKIDCFPISDCKVICADQSGRGFVFDADTRKQHIRHGEVFQTRVEQQSNLFEAFIYRKPRVVCVTKAWHCHQLPPPPYLHEPAYLQGDNSLEISSYGVVDVHHICISINGVSTYCFHTMNHTWKKVGEWTLPFKGKVEYVPEFKLWFGLSAEDQHLAAADLSCMNSQPKLLGALKELEPPDEWKEFKDSQLVNLGSGRFCIARFFQAMTVDDEDSGDEVINDNFAVLTGVEVSSSSRGKVKLQMTPHKSRCVNNTSIEALF